MLPGCGWHSIFSVCRMLLIRAVHRCDPIYTATHLHFKHLINRYGCPIVTLNLIKVRQAPPVNAMKDVHLLTKASV